MQKWDYLYIRYELAPLQATPEYVKWVNSKKVKPIPLPEYLAELGSHGWELVTAPLPAILYFKRPKE